MASPVTRPSRLISKTATGCWPGIALSAQRSVTFACTRLRYHAKGKSVTLSVIAPAPCGDPSRRPMGGGVVARATVSLSARSGAGAGLDDELAIEGSSLSPARGAADGRGASARSGSSRARAGISGAVVSRVASRCGSSVGRAGSAGATSSGRGGSAGVACPCGEPTAATAGTRLTMYVFGCDGDHTCGASTKTTARTTCSIAERTVAMMGSGAFPRAGPRAGRIRIVAAAMLMSALADGLGHHAEALDAGAPDHVHRLDHRAVGEARVGLEVDGLVLARAEGVAEHALEAAGRNTLLVQVERAVLRHREDHALLHRGRLGGRARQVHVDPAVHHRGREHEDQQEDEDHVDQRDDVDLGEARPDAARAAGRPDAKCHLSWAARAWARGGSGG